MTPPTQNYHSGLFALGLTPIISLYKGAESLPDFPSAQYTDNQGVAALCSKAQTPRFPQMERNKGRQAQRKGKFPTDVNSCNGHNLPK